MKNKILNVVLLTVIYCFAISTVPKNPISTDVGNNSTFSQEKIILGVSAELFCTIYVTETIAENNLNFPVPNFKNQFPGLCTALKNAAQLFFTRLSQNIYFSRNILVNARKLDLIFPFQYFW